MGAFHHSCSVLYCGENVFNVTDWDLHSTFMLRPFDSCGCEEAEDLCMGGKAGVFIKAAGRV